MLGERVILQVKNVSKTFLIRKGVFGRIPILAVDNASLELHEKEILTIIGESGAGKTTLARIIANIIKPDSGEVLYDGVPISKFKRLELAKRIQYVFQDPFSSLPPHRKVEKLLGEIIDLHGLANSEVEKRNLILQTLKQVGLTPPELFLPKYPHELSGGQRQRLAFARAIILKPKILIADEPVSMLDVSIRASILELMKSLVDTLGISIIYVTHDIATAKMITDTVYVMYKGRVIEKSTMHEVLTNPAHPYTLTLINSLPELAKGEFKSKKLAVFESMKNEKSVRYEGLKLSLRGTSCVFTDKCPFAMEICKKERPEFVKISDNHEVACFLYGTGKLQ